MPHRPTHPDALDQDEVSALAALGADALRAVTGRRCPDPSLLGALEEGTIEAGPAAAVQAHLQSCETCRALAVAMRQYVDDTDTADAVARVRRRLDARIRTRPAAWRWGLPAGSLALAASLAWWVAVMPPTPPHAPVPPVLAMPGPIGSASVFKMNRPILDTGGVELAARGEAASAPPLLGEIDAALDLAEQGGRQSALATLEAMVNRHPDSANAALALGAVLLGGDRPDDALSVLDRGRRGAPGGLVREFDWHRAVAFVRLGAPHEARPLLESVCRAEGPRQATACAGLLLNPEEGKR